MIELLEKYYNITIDKYDEYNNGIIFYLNGDNYYLCETIFDESYLNILSKVILEYKSIRLHEFILNINGSIKSESYVLLRMKEFIYDINIDDIKRFCIKVKYDYKELCVNMIDFWQNKIDYMEYQIEEISDNQLINNSFNYFVGIGENLLLYLSDNNYSYDLYLSHRVFNSLSSIEFYNPLNIVFDSKYRDIAYYICWFKDIDCLYNVINNVSLNEYVYFFVRLVFPFKYFNEISRILIDKSSEKEMVNILNNIDSYENWFREMENIFNINLY